MPFVTRRALSFLILLSTVWTSAARMRVAVVLLFFGYGHFSVSTSQAGGGPENVFLLVNSTSQDSLAVANYYIAERKIPPNNVFYVPLKGSTLSTTGASFRRQILKPAFAEIGRRKLTTQIDYLIYSCDFPWRVSLARDFPNDNFPKQLAPRGSLTGLTYLHAFVNEKRKEVVSLNANLYHSEPVRGLTVSRAFRRQYRWSTGGKRTGAAGISYIISAILGVTGSRGSTVSEITNSLRLAREADGTRPSGTVYFMKHGGPRSAARHDLFAAAASELRRAGVAAEVSEGKFPQNKRRIAGLTCGTSHAELETSGCRFLPGAFCDNLTSSGGFFSRHKPVIDKKTGKRRKEQTNAAEFIRRGATAACGTVYEPYAIRQKFPLPSVHVHYANGCSLGESFYQSVSGPYQQLLVGDPLCQPWANIPVVVVDEISEGSVLRGQVKVTPRTDQSTKLVRDFELYIDGRSAQRCKPGKLFELDTTTLRDGYHELRIVARDRTPIETQGRLIVGVTVKNGRDAIGLATRQNAISAADTHIAIDVTSTTSAPVEILCNSQKLGSLPSGSGPLQIATDTLGAGSVEIYAVSRDLRSKPLRLEIAR